MIPGDLAKNSFPFRPPIFGLLLQTCNDIFLFVLAQENGACLFRESKMIQKLKNKPLNNNFLAAETQRNSSKLHGKLHISLKQTKILLYFSMVYYVYHLFIQQFFFLVNYTAHHIWTPSSGKVNVVFQKVCISSSNHLINK